MDAVPMDVQVALSPSPGLAQSQPALPTVTIATGRQAAAGVTGQQARQTVHPHPALPTGTAATGALLTKQGAAGVTRQGGVQTAKQVEALPHLGKRSAQDADLQVCHSL